MIEVEDNKLVSTEELLSAVVLKARAYVATKEDADNDNNINHDRKNERRVWRAYDALKIAVANFEAREGAKP